LCIASFLANNEKMKASRKVCYSPPSSPFSSPLRHWNQADLHDVGQAVLPKKRMEGCARWHPPSPPPQDGRNPKLSRPILLLT
jgi:hypothetical protein